MTSPNALPQMIMRAIGAPATMRVGTIASINPLVLSVQGALFQDRAVGVLGSYSPVAGDTVSVVGQSSSPGSDPSTWLILGKDTGSSGTGRAIGDIQFASATNNLALTAVITPVPGATFNVVTKRPNALLLSWWVGDFNAGVATATTGVCYLYIDGVQQPQQAIIATQGVGQRGTEAQVDLTVLATPGTHTVLLQGARVGGADGVLTLLSPHTTVMSMVIE